MSKIACVLVHLLALHCGGKWARSYVTSQEDPLAFVQYVPSVKYGEKKANVSGGDSDSGSLSPSCTSKAGSGKSQTWKLIQN